MQSNEIREHFASMIAQAENPAQMAIVQANATAELAAQIAQLNENFNKVHFRGAILTQQRGS